MRYAQLVIGPAGGGKSTYCSSIVQHVASSNKVIDIINLDPGAEYFDYEPLADVRELIHLDDAMEDVDLQFGPNGGLLFCFQYLIENIEWLKEKLGEDEDDYILFDCPGQIELYTHMTTFKQLIEHLQNWNFQLCAVFIMDVTYMVDPAKFISGAMAALSVMINLEIPHLNILSKMDLLSSAGRKQLDGYLDPDLHLLSGDLSATAWGSKYCKLTESIGRLLEDYSLVKFIPLNLKNPENIDDVLLTIANILQYGENSDVKTKDFECPDPEDIDGNDECS